MTVDMWLTVADSSLLKPAPRPETLQEAMQTWTVAAIEELFPNVTFTASNGDLQGGRTGKKQRSFSEMVEIFFPPPGKVFTPKSIWHTLAEKGYIKDFHRIFTALTARGQETLNHALRVIFRHLPCLPPAKPCGSGRNAGSIWKASEGTVEIVTNSLFYRLERIGNAPKKRENTARIRASNAVITARLDEEHRGIPYRSGRKKFLAARRSAKSRNYRKPPTKPAKATKHGDADDQQSGNASAGSTNQKGRKSTVRPRLSTKSKNSRNAPAKPTEAKTVDIQASREWDSNYSDRGGSSESGPEPSSSDNGGSEHGGSYRGSPLEKGRKYALRPRPSPTSKSNTKPTALAKPGKKAITLLY
jgi:hypothetical protein